MHELAQVFEVNRVILYSIYGQVFFVMGLAVLFQSHKYSRLDLARAIWLLGAFGILHGMSEWAFIFVPVQAEYLPSNVVTLLWMAHAAVEALSFACLFQFGVELLWPEPQRRWARFLPAEVFVFWCFLFFFTGTMLGIGDGGQAEAGAFTRADILARYLLALPGSVLAGAGLIREARDIEAIKLHGIARYLRGAAASFFVYAMLAGVLVPSAEFFPASVLNNSWMHSLLGIPVPVFRSLCGLAIAYYTVRAIKVFDVEMDRMIEKMERNAMIASERERISRELHDGTIQSIYAAGLALEDVAFTIPKDPELATQKTRRVMESLNDTIAGIRNYILDLRSAMENSKFEEQLRGLVDEFASRAGMVPKLTVVPDWRRPLGAEQSAHLLQVAREALANAAKHSGASKVVIRLKYDRERVKLEVQDNGRGFDLDRVAHNYSRERGNGIQNMSHRMGLLKGYLVIHTEPGQGTRLVAEVPFESGGS